MVQIIGRGPAVGFLWLETKRRPADPRFRMRSLRPVLDKAKVHLRRLSAYLPQEKSKAGGRKPATSGARGSYWKDAP